MQAWLSFIFSFYAASSYISEYNYQASGSLSNDSKHSEQHSGEKKTVVSVSLYSGRSFHLAQKKIQMIKKRLCTFIIFFSYNKKTKRQIAWKSFFLLKLKPLGLSVY